MKKIIISFGGCEVGENRHNNSYGIHRNYSAEVKRLFESASVYNFDGYWEYDNNWIINSPYYQTDARKVLDEPSFGWAFKPIVIYDALSMMDEGDFLLWMDSNDLLINDPYPLMVFSIKNNLCLHDHSPTYYPNSHWTNRDMFIYMGCDSDEYYNAPQIQVNIMGFIKNSFTVRFMTDWVRFAIDYNVMIKNNHHNLNGFVEHRHEQSICSILAQKYKVNYLKGYPQLIAKEMMGINCDR